MYNIEKTENRLSEMFKNSNELTIELKDGLTVIITAKHSNITNETHYTLEETYFGVICRFNNINEIAKYLCNHDVYVAKYDFEADALCELNRMGYDSQYDFDRGITHISKYF